MIGFENAAKALASLLQLKINNGNLGWIKKIRYPKKSKIY